MRPRGGGRRGAGPRPRRRGRGRPRRRPRAPPPPSPGRGRPRPPGPARGAARRRTPPWRMAPWRMAPWLTGPWLTGRCRTTPRHPRRQGPLRAVPLGHGLRHLERRQYRTYGPWNGSRSSVAMTLPLGRRWPETALAEDSTGRRQHWPKTALAADQRLEYSGAFRAFFSPAFLRSFTRASLVRKPARFRLGRFSGSTSVSARAIPSRSAPACPVTPPPAIRATTSDAGSAPSV